MIVKVPKASGGVTRHYWLSKKPGIEVVTYGIYLRLKDRSIVEFNMQVGFIQLVCCVLQSFQIY